MTPFDPASGLPVALALRLVTIAVTLLAGRRHTVARRVAFIGSAIASVVTGMTAAAALYAGRPLHGVLLVHRASQFSLSYTLDGLAAWFLAVLSILAVPIAVFSIGYVADDRLRHRSAFIGVAFNALVGAIELVFAAGDAFTFLFAWELMTLASAALVVTEHEERSTRRAAYRYLVMSHVGTGCLIAGFLVLAAAAGSLSFSAMLAGHVVSGPMRDGVFALFFLGFGVKAGIIPLHVWLPEAHPAAPTNISALMSSVLIKTGIYGIVRVCAFGLGVPRLSWGVFVIALGGCAAPDLRSGTGTARGGRGRRVRLQRRDFRRGHVRRCRGRRPRPACGRLHSRLSAATPGDSQRAARRDGRSRSARRNAN
jgi:hydrogenase-4 component B